MILKYKISRSMYQILYYGYLLESSLQEFVGKLNSLLNDKILDWSKMKALADNKINVAEKLEFV